MSLWGDFVRWLMNERRQRLSCATWPSLLPFDLLSIKRSGLRPPGITSSKQCGLAAAEILPNRITEHGGGQRQTRCANHHQTEREEKPLINNRADHYPFR
jgi:hypothetical protein